MNESPTARQLTPTASQPVVTMVSGPVLKTCPSSSLSMNELVEVGKERLLGEVISLDGDVATIQVFENTSGISPGYC